VDGLTRDPTDMRELATRRVTANGFANETARDKGSARDTRADRRGLVLAAERATSNEVSAPLIRRLKAMLQATCCRIVLSNTK